MLKTFSHETIHAAEAYRIAPTDTNYFAILFDPKSAPTEHIYVVEIFTKDGATPPNSHSHAHEFFYVIEGEGIASSDGDSLPVRKGDALLLQPGSTHIIQNTGPGKLYTLTIMTPDQDFSDLIRSGERVSLDEEDLRVLAGR